MRLSLFQPLVSGYDVACYPNVVFLTMAIALHSVLHLPSRGAALASSEAASTGFKAVGNLQLESSLCDALQ